MWPLSFQEARQREVERGGPIPVVERRVRGLGTKATGPRLLNLSCLPEAPGLGPSPPTYWDRMFLPNTGCLVWQVSKAIKS